MKADSADKPADEGASADPAAALLEPLVRRMVDYERTRPDRRLWSLEGIRALLDEVAPARPRLAVQIAGSKGKGTTGAFLAGLARAAGLRVGVYSSPHVETVCERIVIDGEPIDPVRLRDRVAAMVEAGERLGIALTFFEVMTAAAACEFGEEQLDLVVYEAGLGGRFDATTAIAVDASIVTGVELEHTEVLGDTVEAIASEKAAVIRPEGTAFTAARGAALNVIASHAAEVGAVLHTFGEGFRFTNPVWSGTEYCDTLCLPDGAALRVRLPDARAYELPALALAVATLQALRPSLELSLDPVARPGLPGRFEVLSSRDGQPLVLDGAHTEESMAAVASEFARRWPGQKIAVLFACAKGKRWRTGLSQLLPIVDSIVVAELSGTVGEDPVPIAEWLRSQGQASAVVDDVAAGLAALESHSGPRLVVGSFYLVGRARQLHSPTTRNEETTR